MGKRHFPSGAGAACRRAAVALALIAAAGTAPADVDPSRIHTRLVASGLIEPVQAAAPLADNRVFIVERGGTIRVASGGAVVGTFLSIPVSTSGEEGLLGLAFDPGYATPGAAGHRRFFVNYIDPTTRDTVIASYRTRAGDPTLADPASRVEVMRIDQPAGRNNHKAGWLGFKPGDANHLYIATGDGGGAYDPDNFGQRTDTLLGKMLRIDVNRDDFANADVNYGIPLDNPLVGTAGARGEIFARGLRNPFRASFDRATGDLWIGDVGQGDREEIDVIAAGSAGGQNFGWRLREGDIATPGVGGDVPGLTDPVLVYGHDVGRAVTGGVVLRDAGNVTGLNGRYVFGDSVSGRIWVAAASGPLSIDTADELTDLIDLGLGGPIASPVAFGEAGQGELLIVDYGGKVVMLVPEPGRVALTLAGLGLVGAAVRRRRAARA